MEFIREPRLPAPPLPVGEIGVEAPPGLPKAVPANPLARLLPVAMMVAAVGMMALYFTSGGGAMRNPMFMFFPAMMLVSVVGTLAYGSRGTNRTAEINENRRDYLQYIDTLDVAVTGSAEEQHRSLHWSHPAPESLWTLVGGARMWERGPEDPDFCRVRVGVGEQPLCTSLVAPELGPDDDPVTAAAVRGLIRHRSAVGDLPIAVAIRGPSAIAVDGETVAARALLRAMVCQLAVLHSPEDVQIAAVLGPAAAADWEWLKWLPHHQHPRTVDAAGSARLMYRSLSEAVADCTPDSDGSPHLAVIVDGGDVATGAELGSVGRVTLLQVGAAGGDVAADQLRLLIAADALTIRSGGDDTVARPDGLTPTQASACARRLAAYRPAAEGMRRSSMTVGWAELMGLDDPARIDPAVQWVNTHGAASLRVPIGVSERGEPVALDIKEAARNGMGPHGLCVGATGSGKSEFLRTLTLGMIATHSPDVLNLVLVDFKGGATFLGLERARHVAAIITNLSDEAHLVNRMRDALAGEMNRRQELLRAAGNFANTNEYERVRSRGGDLPTLPALFIVVDEFSELLSQHPDFAELFVAIGRLGRSLGMHLLLASQRLDEGRLRGLETHLSYRICLKTFSASESRAVLGVPDAYHLPSAPGAAYLKTASGELVRFQTAFVSGPYREPRADATAPSARLEKPVVFTAAPVGQLNCRAAKTSTPSTRTLFDSIVDRVADNGTPAHRVWLPPLMGSPTLDMLIPRDDRNPSLTVPIGLVDSPYEQRRDLLVAELGAAAGNVAVVGAPRSGKSTALRTLMMALATTHSPADVQFYCLDFGGGSLSSLRPMPHVGSVAGRHDVDLCRRTVAVMESVVRAREAQFRRLGIDSVADYRRRRAADDPEVAGDPFGDVFLVVDGWGTLRQEFDTLEAPITALAAQGLSFGVHVVVVASRWAELRPAVKDQIGTRIELRLGDPADSEMDRKRARQLSGSWPGHGITRDGREMVIALPRFDGRPAVDDLAEAVAASAQRLSHRWDGPPAPPIELLPARVHHHAVVTKAVQGSATEMVIGLGERELEPVTVNFADQPHLLVLGEAECGKTSTLRLLCREIMRTNDVDAAQLEIVDFRRTLLGVVESEHLAGYTMSAAALTSRLPALLDRLQARMPGEQVTQQQLRTRSWWSGPDIYLVIDDYDLVGGASGNPLAPVAEFLPHAKDLGLHVVVARRSGGAARAMFDPFVAGLRDVGCMGLMMSASSDEGVLLGSVRPSSLPAGRGTLITRGGPDQLIQVGWSDPP